MITFRVALRRKRQGQQRGEAMGFPELADVAAAAGQHIQRMGFRVEGAVPVALDAWRGQGVRQKGAARGWQVRQGAMRHTQAKTQTMPGEKRHRARAEPPSRISTQPPAAPTGKAGFRVMGFAKNRITGQGTLLR